MVLESLNKELSALVESSKVVFDVKAEADEKGNNNKNPFGLDLELLGGSRPRLI